MNSFAAHPERASALLKYNPVLQFLSKKNKLEGLSFKEIGAVFGNIVNICGSAPYSMVELFLHKEQNALHGPLLVGRKLMAITERLDLKLFKDIALKCNCSINDIFTHCVTGAVKKLDSSADSIRILVAIGGLKPGLFGSQNSLTFIQLDTNLEEDHALNRLTKLSRNMDKAKSSPFLLAQIVLGFASINHIPLFAAKQLHCLSATLGVTNLVGPQFEINLNGDPVIESFFLSTNPGKRGKPHRCYYC